MSISPRVLHIAESTLIWSSSGTARPKRKAQIKMANSTENAKTGPAEITVKDFALKYGYDQKAVRRVMRSMTAKADQPGSGNRWALTAESEKALADRMSRSHNRRTVTFAPVIADTEK